MKSSLANRLARLSSRIPSDPAVIIADRPLSDDDTESLLRNWRSVMNAGRASRTGSALYVIGPDVAAKEWEATYCGEPI